MKTFIAILLVGFLGFLGCSESDDGTSTFNGEAIPVAPSCIIETFTPTYEWTPVPGATRYLLMVEDFGRGIVIEEWYTPAEVECASEDHLCSVTPEVDVSDATWKVQACAGENCGLWSDELSFNIPDQGGTQQSRWDCIAYEYGPDPPITVMDNHTKLVWTFHVMRFGELNWEEAKRYCEESTYAGFSDWRVPSLREFASLEDKNQRDPALPDGHPFIGLFEPNFYWTSTSHEVTYYAWCKNFFGVRYGGYVHAKTLKQCVWCVRGGD